MIHKHFAEIDSTQTYLKTRYHELSAKDKYILISAEQQTHGQGRRGNTWESFQNSLSFSFTCELNTTPSLTPLEIAFHLCQFLNQKYNAALGVKWPNDLLNQSFHKVSGILCHGIGDGIAIVGIGINIGPLREPEAHYKFKNRPGFIKQDLSLGSEAFKLMPIEIYQYLIDTRKKYKFTPECWNRICLHINKNLSIVDDHITREGKFLGVGEFGQALLQKNNEISECYTGSVLFSQ